VELLALPKANGIAIRYTTDGSSPTSAGFATYDGPFRVPRNCRIVCAMAVAAAYDLNSETIRIRFRRKARKIAALIPRSPPAGMQQTKLDDPRPFGTFIQRLEKPRVLQPSTSASRPRAADGQQNVEYSGALEGWLRCRRREGRGRETAGNRQVAAACA
jgi:hypothetical protein